jgi:hypothetical protein
MIKNVVVIALHKIILRKVYPLQQQPPEGFFPAMVRLATSAFPFGYGFDSSIISIPVNPVFASVSRYSSRVTEPAQHSATAAGSLRYSAGIGFVA